MKILIFFPLALFIQLSSFAQHFEIKEHSELNFRKELYKFPILVNKENMSIAEKINHKLQLAELDTIITKSMKGAFTHLWPQEGEIGGTSDYYYKVTSNNDRYFGIEFGGEGCGAYCETYSTTYNFYASTGTELKIKELFTTKGFKFVDRAILGQQTNTMQKMIIKLKKEAASDPERSNDAIDMYKTCMEERKERKYYNISEADIYLTDSLIKIVSGRCSNHAMRALDEIDDFENTIPLALVVPCLNDKGKKLFNITSNDSKNTKEFLYRGTINKNINIQLFLKVDEVSQKVSGVYFYEKIGGFIILTGTKKGNEFVLFEKDESGKVTGKFSANQTDTYFIGNWINPDNSKTMPLSLNLEN